MRHALLALVLLAGCFQGGEVDEPLDIPAIDVPQSFDDLSARLDPASSEFQDFLVVEDRIDLPGNGSMEFRTGRGMDCFGDADPVAPGATGWVACMVRLVAEPTSAAQDVHALGIGTDGQRLSLRMAVEPVEWRLVVSVVESVTHGTSAGKPVLHVAYDSGWRLVDLSPVINEPALAVEVLDACDVPDAMERSNAGLAVVTINLTAAHGQPFIRVNLGERSRPGDGTSNPFAAHGTGEHDFVAVFGTFGSLRPASLNLEVELEAAEEPTEATPGECLTATLARETQTWTIDVGIVGADGRSEMRTRTLDVEVLLDAHLS